MQTDFYFDIKMVVRPAAASVSPMRFNRGGDDPAITTTPVHVQWAAKIFRQLHLAGADVKKPFAIDLPGWRSGDFKKLGEIVRVFTTSREIADDLADRLEQQGRLGEDTVVGRTQKVPLDFEGPYVVLRRVRQPLRGHLTPVTYNERLNYVTKLPSVRMVSNSNEQAFFLAFARERKAIHPEKEALPDSYGLSLPSRSVFLPDLSVKT